MPQIPIRRTTPADFDVVTTLLAELGRPALTDENRSALRELFGRYLDRPDTSPLVAELEGCVAGFMSLEFRERLNRVQPQAWIPELIVAAPYRGRGVGKALVAHAIDLARKRGCWSVKLESRSHRKEAHQLYRSAGMREVGLYFLLEF
jgi:ribosomal protein S18 acetylase RimI-like enzyme